jgi:hypothetical protein
MPNGDGDPMSKAFKGTVNVDIRDSVPDWAPFEPPKAPEGAPNVVYIVLDDVGFSAMSCYSGPVDAPNIDRIAADGVRFTQWHTTALCSPTRIKNQPGYYELAGEGLCVGRDSGAAVTDDYPGERPYRFTGGTIKRVVVDVSGTPYVDLERQAAAMLARE